MRNLLTVEFSNLSKCSVALLTNAMKRADKIAFGNKITLKLL